MRVVFVGNPGTGKSFILNALIGHVFFRSGVSLGSGLTVESSSFFDKNSNATFVDTPGLDDVDAGASAARQIGASLSVAGPTKLIFVATLEDGRVRPSDVTTVKLVLDALERTGAVTTNNYGILINKLSNAEMHRLYQPNTKDAVMVAFSQFKPTTYIGYFPFLPRAAGKDDLLNPDAAAYHEFVSGAPVMRLSAHDVDVRAGDFRQQCRQLEEQMRATRTAIERMRDTPGGAAFLDNVSLRENADRVLDVFFGARRDLAAEQRRTLMLSFLEIVGIPILRGILSMRNAGAATATATADDGQQRGTQNGETRDHAVD